MATIYLQPGTGTGTGTLADPYYYSEVSTAETAAGGGGTIYLTDGTYNPRTFGMTVSNVTFEALNPFQVTLTPSNHDWFGTGTSSNVLTLKYLNFTYTSNQYAGRVYLDPTFIGCDIYITGLPPDSSGVYASWECIDSVYEFDRSGSYDMMERGGTFTNCTIISRYAASDFGNGGYGVPTCTNCIIACLDSSPSESPYVGGSNNWAYNCTNMSSVGSNGIIGTSDPLFVDPGSRDYQLRPDSPCINKAIAL